MNKNTYFDDDDEDIFSDDEISHNSLSKGLRAIPTWLMADFLAWLDRFNLDVKMVAYMPPQELSELIEEFLYSVGNYYDYSIEEWQYNLSNEKS